jgi:hypothetical protein
LAEVALTEKIKVKFPVMAKQVRVLFSGERKLVVVVNVFKRGKNYIVRHIHDNGKRAKTCEMYERGLACFMLLLDKPISKKLMEKVEETLIEDTLEAL